MTTLRTIDASIAVAPQIAPDAIAELAAAGFTDIINNRPDGEDFGQPDGDEIAAAAAAAGMTYDPRDAGGVLAPADRCDGGGARQG
jgi:uncharacterized protein (TIGR01244 family)